MEHKAWTDEMSEQLALYALGALDGAAAEAGQTQLSSSDSIYQKELAEIQSVMALLAYSAPPVAPPPSLKARLLERVQAASTTVTKPIHAHQLIDFSSLAWAPSEYPGVSFHVLRQDQATGTMTTLVKFQPGSTYPAHRHPEGEDCLVLQGGFRDGRGQYRAGDFVYYEPGSVHSDFEALAGDECVLLVVAHGGIQLLPSEA
jgi:anti-sigma factor ChrR (cupin superfamily)